MAKSSFQFNKRQKELARQNKKEQKRQRKFDKNAVKSEESQNDAPNQNDD